jgi:2-dehydropantoate 2-reductase
MRILVVGAGAIGGYFGGRLMQAGRDVTFLVRPRRAHELLDAGLVIRSPMGDVTLFAPATVLAEDLKEPFDLVLLSCKAYDLDEAVDAIAPAIGPGTVILPLLNGMRHIEVLSDRFGRSHVLGGQCMIGATLDESRAVIHLNEAHVLTFGELAGGLSERIISLAEVLADAGFDARLSEHVVQDMWEKWVFLATLACSTCLMRAPIGNILSAPGGPDLVLALFEECQQIAESEGFAPRPEFVERSHSMLTTRDSALAASMLRDIEAHARIEADPIVGDLLRRRPPPPGPHSSLLAVAYAHLKAYEARREKKLASRNP